MPFQSAVYIVCAAKPHVGKTLLARVLVDFFLSESRPVAAFDLNTDPELTRAFPSFTETSEIADIQGQMRLFDRLVTADETAKIVDVGAAQLAEFLKVARETGFVDEARRRSIAPVFLFITAPERASADRYAAMLRDFPTAMLMPVQNNLFGKVQYMYRFAPNGGASLPMEMPMLVLALRKYLDMRISLSGLAGGNFLPGVPIESQRQIQRFVRKLFVGFRELELRILLNEMKRSLQSR